MNLGPAFTAIVNLVILFWLNLRTICIKNTFGCFIKGKLTLNDVREECVGLIWFELAWFNQFLQEPWPQSVHKSVYERITFLPSGLRAYLHANSV